MSLKKLMDVSKPPAIQIEGYLGLSLANMLQHLEHCKRWKEYIECLDLGLNVPKLAAMHYPDMKFVKEILPEVMDMTEHIIRQNILSHIQEMIQVAEDEIAIIHEARALDVLIKVYEGGLAPSAEDIWKLVLLLTKEEALELKKSMEEKYKE